MLNKKAMLLLAAVLCTMSVTACENTWHGMGRDMEKNGEKMQDQYN